MKSALLPARGDFASALGNFVVCLIMGISSGLVATAPLGQAYLAHGIVAGLISAVLGTGLPPLLGGSACQFNAPRLTVATILASGVGTLLAHPFLRQVFPQPGQAADAILLLLPLISLLAGLLQILAGVLNIAAVIKYLPYPVLTGIIDGIALQIIFGQLPALLGYPAGTRWLSMFKTAPPSLLLALIGLITLALMFASARLIKKVPPHITGLLIGALLFHLLLLASPHTVGETLIPSDFVPFSLERFTAPFVLIFNHNLFKLLPDLLSIAVTVAIVVTVQSLLSLSLADSLFNQRSSPRRELLAQGAANLLTGLVGGYASGGSPAQVQTHARLGGKTAAAHLLCALLVAIFLLVLMGTHGVLLRSIPLCVMGAILVYVGLGMTDRWTLTTLQGLLASKDKEVQTHLGQDLFLALLVTALTIFLGATIALIVGMATAFLLFLNRSGASLVRRKTTGRQRRSLSQWSRHCEELLQEHGDSIVVLELQQPLFFGSADRLLETVETEARECRYLILDLKRVPNIDGTGAFALRRAAEQMQQEGKRLLLSHVQNDIAKTLGDFGVFAAFAEDDIQPSTEDALAKVEWLRLRELGASELDGSAVSVADSALGFGLTPEECRMLEQCLETREFSAGERIISDGDSSQGMYLLLSGAAEVSKQLGFSAMRLAIIRPGAFFGEMAMITDAPRSADVFAQNAVRCAYLSIERFHELEERQPGLSRKIVRNLYLALAGRLRQTTNMAQELAG